MDVYWDTDLQHYKLGPQLSLLPDVVQTMGYDTSRLDITDLLGFFQSLGNPRKLLLSEICTLGNPILVMPAANGVSEHSFFALTPFRTYLRSTTGQARLSHLMRLLHVHKEFADGIDVVEVANLFVRDNHRRRLLFETFSKYDLPMKSVFASKAIQTYFNDNEITMMSLQLGEAFFGFKIQRSSNGSFRPKPPCFSNTMSFLKPLCPQFLKVSHSPDQVGR